MKGHRLCHPKCITDRLSLWSCPVWHCSLATIGSSLGCPDLDQWKISKVRIEVCPTKCPYCSYPPICLSVSLQRSQGNLQIALQSTAFHYSICRAKGSANTYKFTSYCVPFTFEAAITELFPSKLHHEQMCRERNAMDWGLCFQCCQANGFFKCNARLISGNSCMQ